MKMIYSKNMLWRKNKKVRVLSRALALGLSIAMLSPAAAFAYPPFDDVPEGMDKAYYDALSDNNMEWSEIADRIKYFNPMYTEYAEQIDTSLDDIQASISTDIFDLKNQLYTVEDTLKGLYESQEQIKLSLPEGSPEREMALKQLETAINEANAGRKELEAGVDTLDDMNAQIEGRLVVRGGSAAGPSGSMSKKSMELQLYPILEQLQSVIEGLFISYGQLNVSRDMLAEQVSLYERLLLTQQSLFSQGLCTEAEVKNVKAQLDSAKAQLASTDSSKTQLQTAIGLQLGYDTSNAPSIGAVPEPDLEYLASCDPVKDLERAAGENSEVRSAGMSDGSSAGNAKRDRNENVLMGQLSSKLSELYADMKQKELLYESSKTTMEKAERTKNSAETMYSLGMLSASEYQAQMLAYMSYKASAELAKLNLTQSINNYRWAVNGVVTLG